jgi:hypothetical protein
MVPTSGTYQISTSSDDGVRLWLDGKRIINDWGDHSAKTNSERIKLSAGKKYPIKMEYYENRGLAVAKLMWKQGRDKLQIIPQSQLTPLSQADYDSMAYNDVESQGTGLTGQYFSGTKFNRNKLTRLDPTVNFNWASGSPSKLLPADGFSVRWQGQIVVPRSDTYTFYTSSDDGVRLWVDHRQLINNWHDHAATTDRGSIRLAAGQRYDIKMEFYENRGLAVAQLFWSSSSTRKQVIPTTQLYPTK